MSGHREETTEVLNQILGELIEQFRKEATNSNERFLYYHDRNTVAANRTDAWAMAMESAAAQSRGRTKQGNEPLKSA